MKGFDRLTFKRSPKGRLYAISPALADDPNGGSYIKALIAEVDS